MMSVRKYVRTKIKVGFTTATVSVCLVLYYSIFRESSDNILVDTYYPGTTLNFQYETEPALLENILNKGVSEFEASSAISYHGLDLIEEYIKLDELVDLRQTANSNTSEAFIIGNKNTFHIGDQIRVQIELFDGFERHLLTGGDALRIWIVDTQLGANSTGYVIDHGNGSYTGVVHALWKGNPEIKISIASTKEHIAVVMKHIHDRGILYYLTGRFENKGLSLSEDTKCTTIPWVKGYSSVCNMTSLNFGMAWYCGRPRNGMLSCKDWTSYIGSRINELSEIAKHLVENHKHLTFPKKFRIKVTGDTSAVLSKDVPCNQRPKNLTWYDKSPTGYFYKNHWRVLECKYSFRPAIDTYMKCLKGRPLIFLGDSTIRYWFVWLTDFLNLKFKTGRWDEIKDKAWQKYAYAEKEDLNVSIVWAPHELPFYGGASNIKNLRSVGSRLDEIGSNSTAIIVLHWYLHIARSSHEVYREHIRNARQAIDRLLKRSPGVEIFIKGPHAVTHPLNLEPHDYIRKYEEQILFEEFKDIQNRVIYLDEWDMTVGSENTNVHPSRMTNLEMIHHLLSYVCFR